jgi:hypothetical protein
VAPSSTGVVTITATAGGVSATASVAVAGVPVPGREFQSPALESLVQTYFADGSINRAEMISLLRAAGDDGLVDALELLDLRYIVSNASRFNIPGYVEVLASNVVNSNPANARFQGAASSNLISGSSATLLNNLIDKWFLGVDLPALTSSAISYRTASGVLFGDSPSRFDLRQGALGDCYFLASLGAMADRHVDAVRNMFIDNGDGTFTVRFFHGNYGAYYNADGSINSGFSSGTGRADYVTVNRQLPAYSNNTFAYSNYGGSLSNPANVLWIALAEKAYAQWNETGRAGRDGTNRYTAIEGGLMARVNAQVLGYNSTDYALSSAPKAAIVQAMNAHRAVTIGTRSGVTAGGLVGGHAYVVAGYSAGNDTFSLFNPWGTSHPTPLTWSQLQTNCFILTIADASQTITFESARMDGALRGGLESAWAVPLAQPTASSSVPASHAWEPAGGSTQLAVSLDADARPDRGPTRATRVATVATAAPSRLGAVEPSALAALAELDKALQDDGPAAWESQVATSKLAPALVDAVLGEMFSDMFS